MSRILHTLFGFTYGGAETMVVDIMNHQVEKHEVHLLVMNDHIDKTLWATIDRRVKLHAIGRKEGSKSYFPYVKYIVTLLRIRPDIIHSHSARLISLLRFSPVKKVYTQHCSLDITSWNPAILNGYSNVMAISDFVKNSLYVRGINHVSVVYNSIDIDSIQKKDSYQVSDTFSIVQVGRLCHNIKGQHLLIEAVKILVDNGKTVKLDFIGDGDSMQHLQNMVKERGLEDVVSFLGTRDRAYIYSHLCSYDMLCHPSLCEGFGLTVAEGMVAGLPVIVSENDGPSELVCEGKYGYLCKKGDVKSLADTILTIMNNYEHAVEVAKKAQMYATREFSMANMVNRIEDVYTKSLQKNNTYKAAFSLIRADYKRYRKLARGGGILKVLIHERGFKYSFWMRLAAVRGVFRPFFWIIYHHYSSKYGIQIPTNIPIGPGLYIGHGIGMAINGTAKIGKNVSLSQFLTIGSNKGHAATIEDNVYIGSHVCIVEDVTIGHDATIGAGAVVTKDIPPYAVAVGVPAKVIKFKEHD